MSADEMIPVSPIAASIYGFTEVSRSSIENYGKALLAISGADGEVSPPEQQWFQANFVETLMLPDDLAEMFDKYNYHGVNIKELVDGIQLETAGDYRMMVIYDAIRMAKADEKYAVEERELARTGATLFGITEDQFRIMEGMVLLEEGNTNLRKALFRVYPGVTPELVPTEANKLKHNAWVTHHFGHTFTTHDSLEAYCQLLLAIAGADGAVAEAEMAWLEAVALAAGVPDDIRATFRSYDYANADIAALCEKFVVDTAMDLDIVTIYLAIQMSGADGTYADEEKDAVRRAASGLGVDQSTVHNLEQLVLVERHVEKLRKSLFGAI